MTVYTPATVAASLSVAGLVKTTIQAPVRADGYRARRFRLWCADSLVAFSYGTWDDMARVAADTVNDCGCPRIPPGIPMVIDTGGAEYLSFKRPNFDATVSSVVIECLDAGISPLSGIVEVEDNYFTRYVQPLGPVQGYHLDSVTGLEDLIEDGGVTTRDAAWQSAPEYGAATDTILGGLGSATLRTNGNYVRVDAGDISPKIDLNASATFILWCRYWDGNGNGLVTGNIGPLDWLPSTYEGGFRIGWIGTDMNTVVADADGVGGVLSGSDAGDHIGLKVAAGDGGEWFMLTVRYDGDENTASFFTRSDAVTWRKDYDTTPLDQDMTPAASPIRFGAAYGLATWEGSLCEGYIFDKALSDSEVEALFQAGYPGPIAGGGTPPAPLGGFSSGFDSGFG